MIIMQCKLEALNQECVKNRHAVRSRSNCDQASETEKRPAVRLPLLFGVNSRTVVSECVLIHPGWMNKACQVNELHWRSRSVLLEQHSVWLRPVPRYGTKAQTDALTRAWREGISVILHTLFTVWRYSLPCIRDIKSWTKLQNKYMPQFV